MDHFECGHTREYTPIHTHSSRVHIKCFQRGRGRGDKWKLILRIIVHHASRLAITSAITITLGLVRTFKIEIHYTKLIKLYWRRRPKGRRRTKVVCELLSSKQASEWSILRQRATDCCPPPPPPPLAKSNVHDQSWRRPSLLGQSNQISLLCIHRKPSIQPPPSQSLNTGPIYIICLTLRLGGPRASERTGPETELLLVWLVDQDDCVQLEWFWNGSNIVQTMMEQWSGPSNSIRSVRSSAYECTDWAST